LTKARNPGVAISAGGDRARGEGELWNFPSGTEHLKFLKINRSQTIPSKSILNKMFPKGFAK